MSSVWGVNLKVSIFGESHGKAIGVVIDGLPPGIKLDMEYIGSEMGRRRPGSNKLSTARAEKDCFDILSGFFKGRTTGTPLMSIIFNTDQRSKDYESTRHIIRPGHADYTGYVKYSKFNDYRGGGHFSGRLTAPLVFAGAIAKQILAENSILVGSHIKSIQNIEDSCFNATSISSSLLGQLRSKEFCVLDDIQGERMRDLILQARSENDSIGGIVEAAILNLPVGIGEPFFDTLEGRLAQLLFSIPAVKGVEFGKGFAITRKKGSEVSDELYITDDNIKSFANNNGGILGGISNGMPVLFNVAIKPTPSIGIKQRTVDLANSVNTTVEIAGRHDPCIVPRAVPVVEAVAALVILDLLMGEGKLK